jgi:hypothetical protein
MGVAASSWRIGRKPSRALLGWVFAIFIVAVALLGPPLAGQSMPAFVEIRHDILMVNREFERMPLRTNTADAATATLVQEDRTRAESTPTKIRIDGGMS